jgi:L-cysteine S-thiosulfotransferase
MKKSIICLWALAIGMGISFAAQADPGDDVKRVRAYFQKKFPTVRPDEYANGLYALPGNEEYRKQWEIMNEFPAYEIGLQEGKTLWETPFPNGKKWASCFNKGGVKIAQHYPYWDKATQKVRTMEMDLIDCASRNGATDLASSWSDLDADDKKERVQLANLTGYVYSLSTGQRINIDLSDPGAKMAFEEGKKFWWAKRGQLNFACADCHIALAGKNMGGNQPLSAALGHPIGWPAQRAGWGRLETIHFRYITCNSQVRAKPLKHGSETYNNLQFYETVISNGLPLTAPTLRN